MLHGSLLLGGRVVINTPLLGFLGLWGFVEKPEHQRPFIDAHSDVDILPDGVLQNTVTSEFRDV